MNSKDLCLLPYLDEVVDVGIDSLKIEGRMKSVHYVASVVKAYRMSLGRQQQQIRSTARLPMNRARILSDLCAPTTRQRSLPRWSSAII